MQNLPYDRDKTTYKDFPLCDDCLASYTTSLDKHYHAQTVACSKCGLNYHTLLQRYHKLSRLVKLSQLKVKMASS
ncbi:hypothetical protein [Francisella orientalis]|uniref:hypothetical protein n=1 Tax=Francisella orientalis TaxID=299583 RepID=UPI001E5100D4|nr:hypothetical protein [Francisella orientalis]